MTTVQEPEPHYIAYGHVTWPDGMTEADADRLAREADAAREAEKEK